jgi:lysine 2,3-aminomutase
MKKRMSPVAAFPEKACSYARALAARSKKFALQVESRGESPYDDGYPADPFGELRSGTGVRGLVQRFPDRVLVMASGECFVNCRHCTRRGILGESPVVESADALARCVKYVRSHPEVRDVLISGGDPLVLPDDRVMRFVDAFAALDHVKMVRLCTRAPCVNPARITTALADRLAKSRKVWVNTQFNCADEVTPAAVAAAAKLVDRGIPVSCQTVLLKGVNDSPQGMLRLLQALSAARIRPYYVFMCDPVAGIERFRVPVKKARDIEKYCACRIGGLSMPRFVRDIPGAKRKEPI